MRGQDDTEKECPTSNTKSPPVEGTNKHKRNNETSVDSSIQTRTQLKQHLLLEEVVDPKVGKALPFSHTRTQLEQHLLWEEVVDPEVGKALPYL